MADTLPQVFMDPTTGKVVDLIDYGVGIFKSGRVSAIARKIMCSRLT